MQSVVTHQEFKSEAEARRAEAAAKAQVEMNTVDLGERVCNIIADEEQMMAAARVLGGQGSERAIIARYYEMKAKGENELTDGERGFIRAFEDEVNRLEGEFAVKRPMGIRDDIKQRTGVDVDEALGKTEGDRSETEKAAVKEYLDRLYPGQRKEDGDMPEADAPETVANEQEDEQEGMRPYRPIDRDDDADDGQGPPPPPPGPSPALATNAESEKARENGVFDTVKQEARRVREAEEEHLRNITHVDGMTVRPATTKTGKQVYIVSGDVKMTDDGTMVDKAGSDESIIIYDAESGKKEMVSPDVIASVDEQQSMHELYSQIVYGEQQRIKDGIAVQT
ncbi:MAG: hypothetical protein HUJ65_00375, partial [Oscillospiraceae bacterium]|nr:hypothetical protein [Oscillospiraceae bacterium]